MRRFMLIHLVCCLRLAVPTAAHAQTGLSTPPALSADSSSTADSQAAPQATTPAAPASATEATRSLFEPTWHQFQFGGRLSSIDGDPARWQRYQDLRDGVIFTDAKYAREDPGGNSLFRGTADNVGYRDQRYFGRYQRTGRFVISGLWDEVPQFYSVDTQTPYSPAPSPLLLNDATQQAIQNKQATLSAYIPIASQFDLRERRDIGNVNFQATPTPNLDVTAAFTTTRHRGELPWGGSFGFSNDVEVALPYDSRTNDFTVGTEWTNSKNMLRVAYNGSWFNNLDDTLVWDSPLQLTDSTSAPGRGRMQLWPTNSAQTVSGAGYAKFAHRTQVTGFISYGFWNNNEPLQPFTINSALPQIALPRTTAEAEAHVFTTNLNLVSRPQTDWQFTAHFREYDYNNQTPHAAIPQFINYDTSVATSATGGPELYAHNRTTFDADATWSGLHPVALTAGYTRNNTGHDFRIFESTGENVLRLSADAVGAQWMTFHAKYEYGSRNGSGLDEALLVEIGEQPAMRHYDLADRTAINSPGSSILFPTNAGPSASRAASAKTTTPTAISGCRKRPSGPCRSRPTSASRMASGQAATTTSNGTRACSGRDPPARARTQTTRCATGPPTLPRPSTTSRSTSRLLEIRTENGGTVVVRLQPRGRELPVYGRPRTDRCRHHHSSRTSSTSCSSCISTCGIAYRIDWPRRFPISTNRSGCTTSPSIRPSSTASSSPARWFWDMSTVRTR